MMNAVLEAPFQRNMTATKCLETNDSIASMGKESQPK